MAKVDSIFKKNSVLSVEARKSGNQLYGQKNHKKNVHKEILRLYGKSIAFAVEDEELALAYGNRSALLLHLKEYEKCLIDIDRALKITGSAELKSKLESRKAKCAGAMKSSSDSMANVTKKLKDQKRPDATLKLPNFRPSAEIPSASEAVTAKYNEKFGRHLVATRDIKPGEVIVDERGYVCFPTLTKRHLVCSHCLSFAWNGIPCDDCAFAMYCSEACKKDAWNEYHDVECKLFLSAVLPLFYREDHLPYMMVASRLLIKAIKSEGIDAVIDEFYNGNSGNCKGVDGLMVEGQLRSDTFRSCVNLNRHKGVKKFAEMIDKLISHIMEVLRCHTSLFNSNESKTNDKTISQLQIMLKKLTDIIDDNVFEYQLFDCGCEDVTDCRNMCDAKRGVVLAPISCLINHSCYSNVGRLFLPKGKVAMFTVAPVKKGEQLFISYGSLFVQPKEYRQLHLQELFHFTCKCRACEENWPHDPEQIESAEHRKILTKIRMNFAEYFPLATNSSMMKRSTDWKFDEETLKHAVKLSELTYKYFDNIMLAWYYNTGSYGYISQAFDALYGEKFTISDEC